ncbi:MAG: hypothetical protein KME42_16340 [Tildeniella nuda ZEHNDER 1965/U140]|jgi:hypothetical protein|nr:hypothetical protein [Tildeniella nuda ZEHNDER 1965/U140]
MSNFNPDPVDPNRVKASRDVAQDNQAIREQNITMREQNRAIRENDSAATGLMLGVLMLGLAALGFGTYFLTQRPTPVQTRIIEREKTTVPASPSTVPNVAPDVNVTVPNPAPPNVNIVVPEPAPSVAPPVAPSVAPTSAPSDVSPQTAPANP